jgi:hypothetical protein
MRKYWRLPHNYHKKLIDDIKIIKLIEYFYDIALSYKFTLRFAFATVLHVNTLMNDFKWGKTRISNSSISGSAKQKLLTLKRFFDRCSTLAPAPTCWHSCLPT